MAGLGLAPTLSMKSNPAGANPLAPVSTIAPSITGLIDSTAGTGSIGGDDGTWTNTPTAFVQVIQKLVGVPGAWTDLPTSGANPYTPSTADGVLLRRKITATNALGYSGVAYSVPVQYVGQVTGSTYIPTTQHTDTTRVQDFSVVIATLYEDVTTLNVELWNRQGTSNGSQPIGGVGEIAGAADFDAEVSVAPLGGTPIRFTSGGNNSATATAGGKVNFTGSITAARGSQVEIRIKRTSLAVLACTASERLTGTDQIDWTTLAGHYYTAAAIVLNDVMTPGIPSTGNIANTGFMSFPQAVVAPTNRPTMCIFGDSIAYGAYYGTAPANSATGIIAPALATAMGVINQGNPGDRLTWSNVAGGMTMRAAQAKYASYGWMQMMRNDKTVLTNNTTIRTAFNGCATTVFTNNGRPYVTNTCTQKSSSSNSWSDYAGQLPLLNEAPSWATWNDDQRNKVSPLIQKTYDMATLLNDPAHLFEDSWASNGTNFYRTVDGTHPARVGGYDFVRDSGLIDPVADYGAVLLPVIPPTSSAILTETTGYVLMETGDRILLE